MNNNDITKQFEQLFSCPTFLKQYVEDFESFYKDLEKKNTTYLKLK